MAVLQEYIGMQVGITATEAIAKHRLVGYDGGLCGAGAKSYGVSWEAIDDTKGSSIVIDGVIKVEAGGAVSVGAGVKSDANGKGVTASGTDIVNGYAVTASSTDGDFILIKLV